MRRVVKLQQGARPQNVSGDLFSSDNQYSEVHPEVRVFEHSRSPHYPYFRALRVPTSDEIADKVAPFDSVTSLLLEGGVPPEQISQALGYDEVCGQAGFQELYLVRPLWAIYLEVRNIGTHPIHVNSIKGLIEEPSNLGFRPYLVTSEGDSELELPKPAILPGQSALVPLAMFLGPLDQGTPDGISSISEDLSSGQVQEVQHVDYSSLLQTVHLIGPAIWPRELVLVVDGSTVQQEIHEFDLSNLFVIDRYWESGSCPLLFFVTVQGGMKYVGELFGQSPCQLQNEEWTVPNGVRALVIAEIEAETTHIEVLSVNDKPILQDTKLVRGQSLAIEVSGGERIVMRGWYEPKATTVLWPNPLQKNHRIVRFLETWHSDSWEGWR